MGADSHRLVMVSASQMKASRLAVGLAAATATALVAWRLYRRRRPARRSRGTVGFAGLGNMGAPMARRLLSHCDGALTVWNRSEAKAMPLQAAGALVAPSLRALFESCDTVLLMLMGDESLTAAVPSMRRWAASTHLPSSSATQPSRPTARAAAPPRSQPRTSPS